jgi:hypothetical protein
VSFAEVSETSDSLSVAFSPPVHAAAAASAAAAAVPAAPAFPRFSYLTSRLGGATTYPEVGYDFLPVASEEDELAAATLNLQLLELEKRPSLALSLRETTISAKVEQRDFFPLVSARSRSQLADVTTADVQLLLDVIAKATRRVAERLGVDPRDVVLKACKTLEASTGVGDQPLHNDTKFGLQAIGSISYLHYLTAGSRSTSFPTFPLSCTDFLHPQCFFLPLPANGPQAVSAELVRDRMQLAYEFLFDRARYENIRVKAGDSGFFNTKMLHHGSINDDEPSQPRRVLFLMFAGACLRHCSHSSRIFRLFQQVDNLERGRLRPSQIARNISFRSRASLHMTGSCLVSEKMT